MKKQKTKGNNNFKCLILQHTVRSERELLYTSSIIAATFNPVELTETFFKLPIVE